ncbi:hypothetical protein AB0M36_35760 [Actinoplanes sp. NPDC051346]|uniref:hypothetical protein n=1 Tax=Actinoplanes sp. NPDC051346 TaxID=3155048 RepID=UPI003441B23F
MPRSDRIAPHHAVVLMDGAGGRELEVVRDLLTALRVPTVLLTNADLDGFPVTFDLSERVLTVGDRRVRPAVVWTRHTGAATLAARAAGGGSGVEAASWAGFAHQLTASADHRLPGRAPVGTVQVLDARRLGVRTPRTVVTTDVAAAARQLGSRRVIVKTPDFRATEPNPQRWTAHLPMVVDRRDVPDADISGPRVVQEYIPHVRELRVYHLNGGICAFEVHKTDPAVVWTDPAAVRVSRVDCPLAVVAAVRRLCVAWGLRYGAFDLLLTRTGEPVFLEANTDGDWLWYERRAGWHGVSFMAAVMVRELFAHDTSKGVRRSELVVG